MSEIQGTVAFPNDFGFCEGVESADQLLRRVSDEAHTVGIDTVYGLHGIVHNADVIAFHEERGVLFVDSPAEIPPEQLVVTSAHGVGPEIVTALEQNGATTFDAACPLVLHTHKAAQRARRQGETVLYVCHGKPGEVDKIHDEVQGMIGHLDFEIADGELRHNPVERHFLELDEEPSPQLLAANGLYRIVTQTTLLASKALGYTKALAELLQTVQPNAQVGYSPVGDVCRAVEVRQAGVEQLVKLRPRRLVVVTDPSSSNGRSYVKLARKLTAGDNNVSVHAVSSAEEAALLGSGEGLTGITASASTPDSTTMEVAQVLGLETPPHIHRKAFKIADLRPGVIEHKIRAHARRVA
jgi:(E)-4-hydroxy-3-methyl-but-2-enyl pyrophosphate reductase